MKFKSPIESDSPVKSLREIKEILAEHKEEIHREYKVNEIGIFGSYVRGEQRKTSDIDILVEFEKEESIRGFEFIGLMTDLENCIQEILEIKPHLASKRHAMESDKWKDIEKEVVYVQYGNREENKRIDCLFSYYISVYWCARWDY